MKNFTRLFALSFLLISSGVANAQTYDLSVSEVHTASTPSNQIPAGLTSPISFTIKNNGSNAIPGGTELWIAIQVNANYFLNPDTLVFTGAFAAGNEITLTTTAGYTFDVTNPSYDICAGAYFVDPSIESNPNNNLLCKTYAPSTGVNNDWEATYINIEEPTNLDGFDIDNYENTVPEIDSLVLTVTNRSNITFPSGYRINFALALNGDTINIFGTGGGVLVPDDQVTFGIANQAIIPEVPQDSGSYDLCLIMKEESDNTDSNDVMCTTFSIIDSYDPFHPSNWPSGTDELTDDGLKLIPMIDKVMVEGVSNTTNITVSDMQGRVVQKMSINEDATISLTNEKSGVYIIQAADEKGGLLEVSKFTKQ